MLNNPFKGMGSALVTPFFDNGNIDFELVKNLVERQINNGANFICILSTTGETPCLTLEEQKELKKVVVDTVKKRVPILVGCGGNSTNEVVYNLKNFDFSNTDGILSVCPFYNKPSQEGLYKHFEAIAKNTNLPIVIYNVPGRTKVNILPKTVIRLANDFKNIVAIKEASGDIEQACEIISNKPAHFSVLSGDDSKAFPLIMCGAEGVISVIGNAYPKTFSTLINLAMNDKCAEARNIHLSLTRIFELLFVEGNPAGIKALMTEMQLIKNNLRLPLTSTSKETYEKIKEVMFKLNKDC